MKIEQEENEVETTRGEERGERIKVLKSRPVR